MKRVLRTVVVVLSLLPLNLWCYIGWSVKEGQMKKLRELLWSKMGHCMRCMRLSFQVAAAMFVILVIGIVLLDWTWITSLMSVATAAAIALWLLHILAFATKASSYRPNAGARSSRHLSRRKVAGLFGQFLVMAAVASATPALAQTCSDGRSPCFSGTCCDSGKRCCCDNPTSKYCETTGTPCVC